MDSLIVNKLTSSIKSPKNKQSDASTELMKQQVNSDHKDPAGRFRFIRKGSLQRQAAKLNMLEKRLLRKKAMLFERLAEAGQKRIHRAKSLRLHCEQLLCRVHQLEAEASSQLYGMSSKKGVRESERRRARVQVREWSLDIKF